MLNLNYATLARAYRRFSTLADADLFASLGWADRFGTPGYRRTDALHLSLALISCKAPLNGPLRVLDGPLRGGRPDAAANRLAFWLRHHQGEPERLAGEQGADVASDALATRRGIAAFMQRTGPGGGQIVLLDGRNASAVCARAQTCHPYEIHLWPLA